MDNTSHPGTTWFISRHPGAVAWMRAQALPVDRWVTHLDLAEVQAGDVVVGTLPVSLAAAVCARGARFVFLSVPLGAAQRSQELSAEHMEALGCRLEPYLVTPGPAWEIPTASGGAKRTTAGTP